MEHNPHPKEKDIAEHVFNFLNNERAITLYNYPCEYLRVTDDLRFSFTLEMRRDNGWLYASRRWIHVTVKLKGVINTISLPLLLDENGSTDLDCSFASDTEGLGLALKHHRPRKPLPFPLDDEKAPVVVLRCKRDDVRSGDNDAEWTTPARPAAAINTMLKRMGLDPLTTAKSNSLLAQIDEMLAAFVPRVEWLDDFPSEIYHNDRCTEYSSCMKGEPKHWFGLYDLFYRDKRLRMIGIFRGSNRVGRALVWIGENPADPYLDRVYAPGHRSTFDTDIVKAVKEFCQAEGIAKTCFDQTAQWFGLDMVNKLRLRVPHGYGAEDINHFPYVDSMRYFGEDGWLRNYESDSCGGYRTLDCTNGHYSRYEGDDDDHSGQTYVDGGPGEGDWYDEDEVCWVEALGENRLRLYCSYSDYLDDYIPDSDSVGTYNDLLIWADDSVRLFDGGYADANDDDLVRLSDGRFAINGHHEVITLHDGTIVVDDGDLDWTTTANGANALRGDCVEVDGVWYLRGTEPGIENEDDSDDRITQTTLTADEVVA